MLATVLVHRNSFGVELCAFDQRRSVVRTKDLGTELRELQPARTSVAPAPGRARADSDHASTAGQCR